MGRKKKCVNFGDGYRQTRQRVMNVRRGRVESHTLTKKISDCYDKELQKLRNIDGCVRDKPENKAEDIVVKCQK